jgi:hypothetical protein
MKNSRTPYIIAAKNFPPKFSTLLSLSRKILIPITIVIRVGPWQRIEIHIKTMYFGAIFSLKTVFLAE